MPIGWYPGHMHKARHDITKTLRSVDAVLEIVDARLPYASANPLLERLIGATPRLRLLNKADLADPAITAEWLAHYRQQGVEAVALDKSQVGRIRKLASECQQRFHKPGKHLFRLMIVGIPNVGKSTLMNILLERKLAKVGNEPAVTRQRQEYKFNDQVMLVDTPGILWPKLEDQQAAYRLAASGAIRNTAIEAEDIALFTAGLLRERYPQRLLERYHLDSLPEDALGLLEAIARKRGCLRKGGVDLAKVSDLLLSELRAGKLGALSLERPEDIPPPPEPDNPQEETASEQAASES